MTDRVVIVSPRRRDYGNRDALWEVCKARWQHFWPDWPVIEGYHETDEPFNRSAATNRGCREAGDWDFALVVDSDVMVPVHQVNEAIARARETGKTTWCHRRWHGLTEEALPRVMTDWALDPEPDIPDTPEFTQRINGISWSCAWIVPRAVWDATGGMDERFEGWGFEDMAWMSLIVGLYGHERIEGEVIHLFHERSAERLHDGRMSATREYTVNCRLGRRYMVALRRDHNLHDRGDDVPSPEHRERDIANLRRDDASLEPLVRKYDLPDWSNWWPTLEELQEGAKIGRMGPEPGITVVMRSGGGADQWPERSRYLRESLASFNEHVSGPFVQKVVFADWDNRFHPELNEIAREAGFYVVGLNVNAGYTPAMQACWSYLGRRAVGQYIFSIEDDFIYTRDVDLNDLIALLDREPDILQVALLRGPYYQSEKDAGGVLQTLQRWQEKRDGYIAQRDHFTANPSLFRKSLVRQGWPSGRSSERVFGDRVLRNPKAAFAYWGEGDPWIEHIGAVRAGAAY